MLASKPRISRNIHTCFGYENKSMTIYDVNFPLYSFYGFSLSQPLSHPLLTEGFWIYFKLSNLLKCCAHNHISIHLSIYRASERVYVVRQPIFHIRPATYTIFPLRLASICFVNSFDRNVSNHKSNSLNFWSETFCGFIFVCPKYMHAQTHYI